MIKSRWFALGVFTCTIASGFLWYIKPESGWAPLLIGGLPLLIFAAVNRLNFGPTAFLIGLTGFAITALMGIWAAYNQEAALGKYWILFGSILIYLALVVQPLKNLRAIIWMLAVSTAALGSYFLITHNWVEFPADLAMLNDLAVRWMEVRPSFSSDFLLDQNMVGGIQAVFLVLTVALALDLWSRKKYGVVIILALLVGLQTGTLLLSSSRAAWFSLAVGLGVWVWWGLSKKIRRRVSLSTYKIFYAGFFTAIILAGLVFLLLPSQLYALAKAVPGAGSAVTRAGLFINAVDLLPDFWLTGGGLQAFAGLYSEYILVIPFLFFEYSHNLYLDVFLEQGIVGILSLLIILGGSFWFLLVSFQQLRKSTYRTRRYIPGVFAALIVMLLHGVFDNPFYGIQGTPLLLVLPGLAVVLLRAFPTKGQKKKPAVLPNQGRKISGGKVLLSSVIVILLGLGLIYYQSLFASVYATLGAVQMAKIELVDFPRETWSDGSMTPALEKLEPTFIQALWYNPAHRTANHRLGLIAMHKWDYESAVSYLETAHRIDPAHRGIRKALGYSYAWIGDYQNAYAMLRIMPETPREMEAYVFWWQEQDRPDLAQNAQNFITYQGQSNLP